MAGTLIDTFEDRLLRPAVSRDPKWLDVGIFKDNFYKTTPTQRTALGKYRNVVSEISAPEFQLFIKFSQNIEDTWEFKGSL